MTENYSSSDGLASETSEAEATYHHPSNQQQETEDTHTLISVEETTIEVEAPDLETRGESEIAPEAEEPVQGDSPLSCTPPPPPEAVETSDCHTPQRTNGDTLEDAQPSTSGIYMTPEKKIWLGRK